MSQTKACRAGRVAESDGSDVGMGTGKRRLGGRMVAGMEPESDGWSAWVVPESDGCRKTRLGVLKRYRKESFGVKDG